MAQGRHNPLWLSHELVALDSVADSDDQLFQGCHPLKCETQRLQTIRFFELSEACSSCDSRRWVSYVENITTCAYCL